MEHWHERYRRSRSLFAMLLILLVALALTGCSDDDNDRVTDTPATGGEQSDDDTTNDTEAANAFTLAVLPDTQKYSRYSPERFDAQTRWIANNYQAEKIAFTMHLGDVVDLADSPQEWTAAMQSLSVLNDNPQTPYSVLAGNHDVLQSWQYDTERDLAAEPYLDYFSPDQQAARFSTFQGADPTGFGSYHIFQGAERQYLVLALDWRTAFATIDWAQSVLDAHPNMPTILTTHQLLNIGAGDEGDTNAIFTDHGLRLWQGLIYDNDQIFLTINGHHHGEASMIAKNRYGRDVFMEVVDYQSGFWGGNGMLQLITFDTDNDMLRFRSFSPWAAAIPQAERGPEDEVERWNFSVPMDFDERFAGLNQNALPASAGNIDGTEAYWILDEDHQVTGANGNPAFIDASGNGNTMQLTGLAPGSGDESEYFRVVDDAPAFGHARGSARFTPNGGYSGYYLRSDAPGLTFDEAASGNGGYLPQYTIEAVVRLPRDWSADAYDWAGVLNHLRNVSDICNFHNLDCSGGDTAPGLNISSLAEMQWVTVSQNGKMEDAWSWELDRERWYHVALVNDGEYLRMYVNGQQTMRSAQAVKQGLLAAPGRPWSIGMNGTENDPGNLFFGDIAEVRINSRVLEPAEWLYSQ
ncbi:LamG-like jellyroll fold domain-containing protein [Salinisphaera sp. C84B14]|uniref:LamG-like jellyroll fold domain-containing protein n=1 Tax=Salinisphaera sp. C84B14 TaxID=1304155 RepID=UPI00333FD476